MSSLKKLKMPGPTCHMGVVQGAASTAKASSQKSKLQATSRAAASAPRAAKKEATSKAADATKTLKSGTKQQTAHVSANRTPREVEELLPMKAQPAVGSKSSQGMTFQSC